MSGTFRILRPLGTCEVGDQLAFELGGQIFEGQITFLSRTPTGGWIVALQSPGSTWEVYCNRGVCNLVSHIAEEAAWTFEELETARHVIDTATGRRLTATRH